MTIVIRSVRSPAQVAIVAALAREIWPEHYVPIIGAAQVAYMLETLQSPAAIESALADGYAYFLALRAGVPEGYVAVRAEPDGSALFLSKLYVRRERRGTGIGVRMLRFAERRARANGLPVIRLTVNRHNTGSIAWYERHGFRKAAEVVAPIGGGFVVDDFRMEKTV